MPIIGIIASSYRAAVTPSYKYLLGSWYGKLYGSTDAITWGFISQPIIRTESLNSFGLWYLGSKYIAGNNGASLYTSTNGTSWSYLQTSGEGAQNIDYYNGSYYIAAATMLAVSTNLVSWSMQTLPAQITPTNIAYGNNTYSFLNNDGNSIAFTSTDLVTWTSRTCPANFYYSVIYANSKFVAVGETPTSVSAITTSTDGITWTSRTPSSGTTTVRNTYRVSYGNSKFVAATNIIGAQVSTDGITWTTPTITGLTANKNWTQSIYAASNFVIAGNDTNIHYSTDAVTWTKQATGFSTLATVPNIAHDGTTWFFGHNDTGTANISSSTNLTTFTTRASMNQDVLGVGGYGNVLRYVNNNYYFIGTIDNNSVSTDLATWSILTWVGSPNYEWYGLAYGNGTYVGAGGVAYLQTSTNGTTWTSRTSGFGSSDIYTAAYGNGVFVIAGQSGKLSSSTDGITWTARTAGIGTSAIYKVDYFNNNFIAVGSGGKITTSTDGITWNSRTSNTLAALRGSAYGNSTYVVVGNGATIRTSTDLVTWTTRTAGWASETIYSVVYGNGLFVAANYGSNTTNGPAQSIQSSTDGITWTSRTNSVMYFAQNPTGMIAL